MDIENAETPAETAPVSTARMWMRYVLVVIAGLPLAVVSLLHTMGRTDDFGVLGEWYVMLPLTLAAVCGWLFVEKVIDRVNR
ncbi:hypothetical protein [Actinoplanes derwentensis]|uniref:Uncharacterized protein n=1 Tax=Actinoplanes derwentensis TaxID=113562 RepID=A0A1H1SDQ8_9ACTN|nr:hypothetical protein [Actinoplanes derwentensis]GID83327.1 hypothetical protein Ade03nite_22510 [Actinoplanes derwentensis]SDS46134.1 hypothetical protein SAMN04489716_0834 [Actinoplanes derwentensis]